MHAATQFITTQATVLLCSISAWMLIALRTLCALRIQYTLAV